MTFALRSCAWSRAWLVGLVVLHHGVLQSITAQSCDMEIWVFDTLTRCNDTQPPNAVGTLYVDQACHAVTVQDSTADTDVDLFPGNYRATCTPEGKVRFLDSGCASETCASTSLNSEVSLCDRNAGTIASLYSRLDVPEYIVQDKSEATVGGYYTCLRLKGADTSTVTFVVFGDCSRAECQVDDSTSTTTAPSGSGAVPTASPVVAPLPTTLPTLVTATDAPSVATETDAPVVAPTLDIPDTAAPVVSPTATITLAPVVASLTPPDAVPTSLAPATSPTTAPPVVAVTESPVVTPAVTDPTNEPVDPTEEPYEEPNEATPSPATSRPAASPPSATLPIPGNGVTDTFSVTLLFSPASSELDTEASLSDWETQTKAHITEAAEAMGSTVLELTLTKVKQSLNTARRNLVGRQLQQGSTLKIDFDVAMTFVSTTADALSAILASGFDSEQDRFKYLKRFELEPLSKVSKVQFSGVDGTPVGIGGSGGTTKDTASGNNTTTLAGIGVGAAVIVLVVAGLLVHQKRKRRQSGKSSTGMTKTNEVESPSSYGDMPVEKNNAASPQRWTNEIVVDPSADDVSTLGGSVLAGLNLENNTTQNGEDEPTASVNLDYDYGRSRYRTEVDDRTRSQMTEGSAAPTTFTNYSKLGMNVNSVYADDASFEQQFAEPDEDEDYHNRSMRKGDERANAATDINNRVKPFEVRAPPGKLGMVVDTPHGGVPVVRAIKADSVLTGRVVIGDRLISVDYQDVTNMTALEVSSLISLKQDQARLLIFCRLTPSAPATNATA